MKTCARCRQTKSTTDFPRARASKDGFYSYCKVCNNKAYKRKKERLGDWSKVFREQRLQKTYGLSPGEFEELAAEQDGKCAICGDRPPRLVVDHDHQTDEVRQLLCDLCNVGLGALGDDPERVERAAAYLIRHQGRPSRRRRQLRLTEGARTA